MTAAGAAGRSRAGRLLLVALGAVAVNLVLFSLAELLTADRPLAQDITEPVPVDLVTLPPPEEAPPPEPEPVRRTEPPPQLDFHPSLTPPVPGAVRPDAVAIPVEPDFTDPGFSATGLVFDSGDLDAPPVPVQRNSPPFPYRARQRNVSGSVTVKLRVEKDGSVGSVEILEAVPRGYFEDAVLRTVPGWRFRPGRIAGRAVASWVVTTVQFDLENER